MLHTVFDLQSTQLVNSVKCQTGKKIKKKLRAHSSKMHYLSTKYVHQTGF